MNDSQHIEPIFHFFADDLNKNDERIKNGSIYCFGCGSMVWCEVPGEFMRPWFDTQIGEVCLDCFYYFYDNDFPKFETLGNY
jgi:hypothetical protein